MNFKEIKPISISLIKEFVYEAKRKSFAGSSNKVTLNNQSSIFSYRGYGDGSYRGDSRFSGMIYTDRFSGNTIEAGTETVSLNMCNVWRNQYYGGTPITYWNGVTTTSLERYFGNSTDYFPFVIIEFLKSALLNLPKEFPVRGPRFFETDCVRYEDFEYSAHWEYENIWEAISIFDTDDPFAAFQGKETIKCNGTIVFWHGYHGGFLRDKYYPILLNK